ncbi:alpha/beta fold hydrolase [Paeniglutamicibacter sp. Y32M11]|uniref:alpha/beta fold hydrolase n=1 Tax=Paeniglutamicibacter sp. Y32M11 TaxID=2853258 RepID=UPI00351D2609
MLILHGDSDRMVSVGNADALLRSFPQAQLQVFPDSGHGVAFQNRQSITGTVNQFLRR